MWSSILDPDIRGASVLWDSADNQTLWDCAESWNEVDFDFRTRIQNDNKAWIWSTLWILGNLLFYFISTIIIDQFVFLCVGFLGQVKGETLFPSFPHRVPGQVRQHCTGLAVEILKHTGRVTVSQTKKHLFGWGHWISWEFLQARLPSGCGAPAGRIESLPLASKISLTKLQCRQKKLWRTCTEPFPATYEKCRGFSRTGFSSENWLGCFKGLNYHEWPLQHLFSRSLAWW